MFASLRARLASNPPLIIAGSLALLVLGVHSFDRWILRGGVPPIHAHAKQKIGEEINARFQQGVLMLHAKQFDHALTAFHRVLQLNPKMPEAHVNMGFALLGLKKPKEARDFFAGALALRPEQVNAYYGVALAAHEMGERQDAMHAMYHYISLSDAADPYRAKAEDLLETWRKDLPAAKANSGTSGKPKESAPTPRRPVSER